MIQLHILRVAMCELCWGWKFLMPNDAIPARCWDCGSRYWQYGTPSRTVQRNRVGMGAAPRVIKPKGEPSDPGAMYRSKNQWRQFKDKEGNPIKAPKQEVYEPPRHVRPRTIV